jgi:hypothetical protein
MDEKDKIKAAISMLNRLKRMVGFFMKKEISELIIWLENDIQTDSVPGKKDKIIL